MAPESLWITALTVAQVALSLSASNTLQAAPSWHAKIYYNFPSVYSLIAPKYRSNMNSITVFIASLNVKVARLLLLASTTPARRNSGLRSPLVYFGLLRFGH